MIHSYSYWFPYNGDTVLMVMVKFNENQYNSSITLIDLGFHNGNYIIVAIIKFTSIPVFYQWYEAFLINIVMPW